MKIYKVENFKKTYGEKTLFKDVNFSIATGDRVGLIGINGTGKSSLLKCIFGIDSYDGGVITHPNDYTLGYLSQDINFPDELTVLDCIFESDSKIMQIIKQYEKCLIELNEQPENEEKQNNLFKIQELLDKENAWEASSSAKTILSKLGITNYDKKISELSGGQKKRVALAKVLIETPDLLLLDEPTNHLDFETIEWLEKYLKSYPNSILVITHDRYFLDNISTRTFELTNGNLFEYVGNYSEFLEKKAEREANEESRYLKDKQLYKKELEWIRRGAKARTTKQQARIDRFEILQDKVNSKVENNKLNIDIYSSRIGKQVFEFENISKKYDEKIILNNFNFIVQNNSRLGIIGLNGVGKSTFLNIIANKETIDSGVFKVGQTVKIAYYSQLTEDMDLTLRMINYVRQGAETIKNSDGNIISAAQLLEQFLFPLHTHGTVLSKLSGGERRRLYLLRLLMTQPNVLILDEPTNDLDTQTLTILEDYLESFSGAVITVSHDRYFLEKVVDELLVFKGNGNITHYIGNYSEYIESGGSLKIDEVKKEKNISENKTTTREAKRRLTYKENKEWKTIDAEIEKLEEEINKVEEDMITFATDFEKINELVKLQLKLKKDLEYKMERWEYLAEIVE